MSRDLHTGNLKLIARVQKAASDEILAVTTLNASGELLVGNGTKADHLDPSTGVTGDVLLRNSAATLGVEWGVVPNAFDQGLNTTDSPSFQNINVTGTQTITNTVTNTVADPLQKWGNGIVADVTDAGWYASYNDGSDRYCGLHRIRGTNTFKMYTGLTVDPATGTDNQVDDTDPSFVPAELDVGAVRLTADNGLWARLAAAATTTTWTLTLPDDKPPTVGESLVSISTSGQTEWADRVRTITLGKGMTAGADITKTGQLSTDNSTLDLFTPLVVAASDMFAVYDSVNNVQAKVSLADVEASFNHDNLDGYVADQHTDHSTLNVFGGVGLENNGGLSVMTGDVTLDHASTAVTPGTYNYATLTVDQQGHLTASSTGVPVTSVTTPALSGLAGGPITSTGALNLDLSNAAAVAAPTLTSVLMTQNAGGDLQKTTMTEFNATLNHDLLSGFVGDEHVPHASVSVIQPALSGLAAANDNLSSNIGLVVDANNLPAHVGGLAVGADQFILYDSNQTATAKLSHTALQLSINHNNLVNSGGTIHTDHANVTLLGTSSGLSTTNGANDLTVALNLKQDINALAALADNVATGDLFSVYDTSSSTTRKATVAEVEVALNHDNLAGFVSTEHVDHGSVNLTCSDTALSKSGLDIAASNSANITVSRALRFRPDNLDVNDTFDKPNDTLVYHDASAANPRKTSMTNFLSKITNTDLSDASFTNTLVDHSGVEIATAANSGLLGGGDTTATRNLEVDIFGTTGLAGSPSAGDEMMVQLDGGLGLRKITTLELNGAMALSALVDYDANDHVDHTAVLIQAISDSGLQVDGAVTAVDMGVGTKQLTVSMPTSTLALPDLAADVVMVKDNDGTGSGLRSVLLEDLMGAQLNLGSAAAGVTVASTDNLGSAYNKVTRFNLTGFTIPVAATADEAVGRALYTFPLAGVTGVVINSVVTDVVLNGTGVVDTDTPEIAVGTTIATGAVATLGGTPTFTDVVSILALGAVDGGPLATDNRVTSSNFAAPAGVAMTAYLNLADGWAGTDTITCTGTVTVNWSVFP
jgi:hypothetical protein